MAIGTAPKGKIVVVAKLAEIGEGIVVAIVIDLLERDELKRRHETEFF